MRTTDLIGEGGFFHSLHISLSLSLSLCPFTFSLFFFSSYSVIFPLLLSQAKVNQVLTFSLLLLIDRWIIFLSMCPFFSFLVSFLRQNSIQCYVLSDGRITRQKCLSWCMRKGRGRDEPKLKCNSHPKSWPEVKEFLCWSLSSKVTHVYLVHCRMHIFTLNLAIGEEDLHTNISLFSSLSSSSSSAFHFFIVNLIQMSLYPNVNLPSQINNSHILLHSCQKEMQFKKNSHSLSIELWITISILCTRSTWKLYFPFLLARAGDNLTKKKFNATPTLSSLVLHLFSTLQKSAPVTKMRTHENTLDTHRHWVFMQSMRCWDVKMWLWMWMWMYDACGCVMKRASFFRPLQLALLVKV